MATTKEAVSTYGVLRPVQHDKKRYERGQTIDLTKKEAGHLITSKAIGVITKGDILLVDGAPVLPATRESLAAAEAELIEETAGEAIVGSQEENQ